MDEFALAFASLIVVIGPWKAAIVFAERTTLMPIATRRLVAGAVVLIGLVISAVFVLFGADLVEFFHIDESAFLVAAGLLVLVFAIRMVILDEDHGVTAAEPDGSPDATAWRLAAYPLAVPLLVTPPAIATLIALSVQASVAESSAVALITAILVVMGLNLVVFLAEAQWEHVIPSQVWSIAGRVLGVLLAAFGASIVIEGIKISGLVS